MSKAVASSFRGARLRTSAAAFIALLALAATLLTAAPATASATAACDPADRPEVYPVDELQRHQMGVGYTVLDGQEIISFDVEILGVDPNGIAPGIPFILARLSGPAMDETNGIVQGMSGSPVYIDGRLVGATAYGFIPSDEIAGITPAEEMVKVFDYPPSPADADRPSPAAMQAARYSQMRSSVQLSAELRREAARAGSGEESDYEEARRLKIPLGVSGVDSRGMKFFRTTLRKSGASFADFRAFRAGSYEQEFPRVYATLEPGSAYAAAFSYGDLTVAGIGTTTARCGDMVLAWGHPFLWQGQVSYGMNAAEILGVIPNDVLPGFKFGVVSSLAGIVDQDRLVAIRGTEGIEPFMTPVVATVTNLDTDRMRHGQTDVVAQQFLPSLAASTMLVETDVVHDRIGDGSMRLRWRIDAVDSDGDPFTFVRENMYYSPWDISYEAPFEAFTNLLALQTNPFEEVRFEKVTFRGEITQDRLTSQITKVLTASPQQPALKERKRLEVKPGQTIDVRVLLTTYEDEPGVEARIRRVDLNLKLPKEMEGGNLRVRGGSPLYCWGFGGQCKAESLDEFVALLENSERFSDLVAEVGTQAKCCAEGDGPMPPGGGRGQTVKVVDRQPDVVQGGKTVRLFVVGSGGSDGPGGGGGKG